MCMQKQMLMERHSGAVPSSFEELEALPGVGHKTASVVLAIAFQLPTFPVDTHIHRCVSVLVSWEAVRWLCSVTHA